MLGRNRAIPRGAHLRSVEAGPIRAETRGFPIASQAETRKKVLANGFGSVENAGLLGRPPNSPVAGHRASGEIESMCAPRWHLHRAESCGSTWQIAMDSARRNVPRGFVLADLRTSERDGPPPVTSEGTNRIEGAKHIPIRGIGDREKMERVQVSLECSRSRGFGRESLELEE